MGRRRLVAIGVQNRCFVPLSLERFEPGGSICETAVTPGGEAGFGLERAREMGLVGEAGFDGEVGEGVGGVEGAAGVHYPAASDEFGDGAAVVASEGAGERDGMDARGVGEIADGDCLGGALVEFARETIQPARDIAKGCRRFGDGGEHVGETVLAFGRCGEPAGAIEFERGEHGAGDGSARVPAVLHVRAPLGREAVAEGHLERARSTRAVLVFVDDAGGFDDDAERGGVVRAGAGALFERAGEDEGDGGAVVAVAGVHAERGVFDGAEPDFG